MSDQMKERRFSFIGFIVGLMFGILIGMAL